MTQTSKGYAKFRFAGSSSQFTVTPSSDRPRIKGESIEAPVRLYDAIRELESRQHLKLPDHSLLILVNGVESSILGGPDAIVNDGDDVVIIPMFHGG
jgi:molybdopterin converting factor small subunit